MRKIRGRKAREREAMREACSPNTELGRRARNLYELFYGEPCPWRADVGGPWTAEVDGPWTAEVAPPTSPGDAYRRNLEAAREAGFDHTRDR